MNQHISTEKNIKKHLIIIKKLYLCLKYIKNMTRLYTNTWWWSFLQLFKL